MNRITRTWAGVFTNRVTPTLAGLAASAVVGAPLLLGAAPASAAPRPASPTPRTSVAAQDALARIQANSYTEIDRRLAALNAAIPAVAANRAISPADKATLTGTLTADVSGLTGLRQTIAADTTVATATADHQKIFTGYRVYALALPQVRFAAAADGITGSVLPALTDAQHALQELLAGAGGGKNTPAVQAKMADLANQLTTISTDTAGLAATVLAYTPADYDANHALLAPSRSKLAAARTAIGAARADIASVKAALG